MSIERTRLFASPTGRSLAVAQPDHHVHVWDVASRRVVARLTGHWGDICAGAFSADGRLATCGLDGSLRVWHVGAQHQTHELELRQAAACALVWQGDVVHLLLDDGAHWRWSPSGRGRLLDAGPGAIESGCFVGLEPLRLRHGQVLDASEAQLFEAARVPSRLVAVEGRAYVLSAQGLVGVDMHSVVQAIDVAIGSSSLWLAHRGHVEELDFEGRRRNTLRLGGAVPHTWTDIEYCGGQVFLRGRRGGLALVVDDHIELVEDTGEDRPVEPTRAPTVRAVLELEVAPPAPIEFRDVPAAFEPAHEELTRSATMSLLDAVHPVLERLARDLRSGTGYRDAGMATRMHQSGLELDVEAHDRVARVRVTHDGRRYRVELVVSERPELDPPPETTLVRLARFLSKKPPRRERWVRELVGDRAHDVRVTRAGGALSLVVVTTRLPDSTTFGLWLTGLFDEL